MNIYIFLCVEGGTYLYHDDSLRVMGASLPIPDEFMYKMSVMLLCYVNVTIDLLLIDFPRMSFKSSVYKVNFFISGESLQVGNILTKVVMRVTLAISRKKNNRKM